MRFQELFEAERKINLQDVPGLNANHLKRLGQLFKQNGFEIRIVGGAVRDMLAGKNPKDYDFATDAQPQEMIDILEGAGIKVIPTGLQHGTITAVLGGEPYEITTLRIDRETDGRHAEVEFTRDWRKDAERRDLTFNAMSIGLDGTLYDYFGGEEDLEQGKAKFVGDAEKRIQEDYLRILRYFRFQGKISSPSWDKETLQAIKNNAQGLSGISGERIWMEVGKILTGNHVVDIFKKMKDTGVLNEIGIPNPNFSELQRVQNLNLQNPALVLPALLNSTKELDQIRNRWKFDNFTYELAKFIINNRDKNFDETSYKKWVVLNKINPKMALQLLRYQGNNSLAQKMRGWSVPDMPVSGDDLIKQGMKPGPDMGKKLNQIKKTWVDSGFEASKEELLKYI